MLKKSVVISIALLLFAAVAQAHDQAQPPQPKAGEVRQDAEAAVKSRVQTQQVVDKWAEREADLMDKAEALQRELDVTIKQRQKAELYLEGQKLKVADLERKLREIERIRAELEPFLDETLERLDAFVAQDMPFLAQERRTRLDELKAKLNDFDATPAQKARRLLEALRIESQYGTTVEVGERELDLDGSPRQVRVLRLGRLGLFAISLDDREAWRYDKADGKWQVLDGYARQVAQAADMAQRIRVISLVELPVGQAPAAGEAAR